MSDGLHPVHFREVQRVLKKLGWLQNAKQRGSHQKWEKPHTPRPIILIIHPSHPEIRTHELKNIIRAMGITPEEFLNIL